MRVDDEHERCSRCREVKPRTTEHFYFSRGAVTGYCRPCQAAWYAAYYRAHPSRVPEQRAWRRRRATVAGVPHEAPP